MKISFLTNIISPHQLPLAKAIVHLIGKNNYRYIYTEHFHQERQDMGWNQESASWCVQGDTSNSNIDSSEVFISELREFKKFNEQLSTKKKIISERWFKPPLGMWRLLVPTYLYMAFCFVFLLGKSNFFYFPQGIHAARDMMRLYFLFHGHLNCLFHAPKVAFESRPGGNIVPLKQAVNAGILSADDIRFAKKNGFVQIPKNKWQQIQPIGIWTKMKLWGYFVAPSQRQDFSHTDDRLSIMWAGRMVPFKNVSTLVKACKHCSQAYLDIYGHGETETDLRNIAANLSNISFHDFVPISKIRSIMSQHNTYILPSNAGEGWGAVINEALEEKMQVFASIESGAGATILPPSNLFQAQDIQRLQHLLNSNVPRPDIGPWTVKYAADYLIDFINH